MSAVIMVDYSGLSAAIRRMERETPKLLLEIIKEQGNFLVRDLIKLTPPTGNAPFTESFGKQRKFGMGAIIQDLLGGKNNKGWKTHSHAGIFIVVDNRFLKNKQGATTTRLWVTKSGDVYGVENKDFLPWASVKEMKARHSQYRMANGRVSGAGGQDREIGRWKFIDKMVVSKTSFRAYKEFVFDKLGIAKAGWMAAAKAVGFNPPYWISKHTVQGGVKDETNNKVSPKMTFWNNVPYIVRMDRQAQIIKRAVDRRIQAIHNKLDKLAGKIKQNWYP